MPIYSSYENLTYTLLGKTAKPANITFKTPVINPATGGITLSWNEITTTAASCSDGQYTNQYSCEDANEIWTTHNNSLDFKEYVVQKAPSGSTVWENTLSNNTEIFRGKALEFLYSPPSLNPASMNFLIKAVDTTGNYSAVQGACTVNLTAPAWGGSQVLSHSINNGQMTITWPVPATAQFAITGYEVRFRTGNSSTVFSGADATGPGTTEGVYGGNNSLTFPITWGPGQGAEYRTFIVSAKDSHDNASSNQISKSIQVTSSQASTVNYTNQSHTFPAGNVGDLWIPSTGSDDSTYAPGSVYIAESVTAGSFVSGTKYAIETIGTTNFTSIGSSANTEGTVFTATGVGSGTGTATTWVSDISYTDDTAADAAQSDVNAVTTNIYASGTTDIDGGVISAGSKITAGTGNNVAVLDGSHATYRIYAGNVTPASAPFSVTKTGIVTAGTGNNVAVMNGSDADYRIYAGHATAASAPFRVKKDGTVTIESASSGSRLVIEDDTIKVYEGSTLRVKLGNLS